MQGIWTLYSTKMDGLKMEKKINEGLTDLTEISIMSVIITVNLIIHILS